MPSEPSSDAALLWAAGPSHEHELALVLVGTLWHYWEITADVTQPRVVANRVVERAGDVDPLLLAPALSGLGTLCWLQGDYGEATRRHEQARAAYEVLDDGAGVAWSDVCLSVQAVMRAEHPAGDRVGATSIGARWRTA